jgi:CDP-diacylglycerol--glycerol-3-phosphate 3-phosphatidyltransferase
MVIIARELAVTMLRIVAVERGVVIAASWLGKAKTILQVAAIFAVIAFEPTPVAVDALLYLAVAVTVVSGADYFFGVRRRMEEARRGIKREPATGSPATPASSRDGGSDGRSQARP